MPVVLYDGSCRFCRAQANTLKRLAGGKIDLRPLQEEGLLERFPGVSLKESLREMKLIDAAGRVYGGAEAVARLLYLSRPLLGKLALAYYLPGLRPLADRLYAWVARNRYRFFGRAEGACESESCAVPPAGSRSEHRAP